MGKTKKSLYILLHYEKVVKSFLGPYCKIMIEISALIAVYLQTVYNMNKRRIKTLLIIISMLTVCYYRHFSKKSSAASMSSGFGSFASSLSAQRMKFSCISSGSSPPCSSVSLSSSALSRSLYLFVLSL